MSQVGSPQSDRTGLPASGKRHAALTWIRRFLACALIAGSAMLVLGGNWVNFLRKTEEQVTARGSVIQFHTSFSLSDITPLLLFALVLLLPDLEEIPTPWGPLKIFRQLAEKCRTYKVAWIM
jgi:hypothetical protein